ncbi:hypothetical protein [Flavobacterium sp.]|uniref:hypothetical protein n=1 Tax=Flavobacterium sp. TaxID=239 RepID=UPI00286E4143|nr:hypothetical protein [Flavobacterium sp.]
MNNLFFIFVVIFVFSSCGKTKEVKINAKNAATGLPYAGLEYVEVTKLGITNTYYDTINLIPGEYKIITIDY